MSRATLQRDAVLRVGEVCEVDGRRIYVEVDKNKNLSDLFLDGDVLKNISVLSYIEIRKGFLGIIGRVEGEKIKDDYSPRQTERRDSDNRSKRVLTISLSGYLDEQGAFIGGTKELPLIGNEAYVVTKEKIHQIHNLVSPNQSSICISRVYGDEFDINFPVDGLFNSHIAIFGNSGSGKSNTLTYLYQELVAALRSRNRESFEQNTKFLLFDFNGEYVQGPCLTKDKCVYNLTTENENGNRLPFGVDVILGIEALSILSDATERTQKPFLRRALRLRKLFFEADQSEDYLKGILKRLVKGTLTLSEKHRAFLLLDYFRQILPKKEDEQGDLEDLAGDLKWLHPSNQFVLNHYEVYFQSNPERIRDTIIYKQVDLVSLNDNPLEQLIMFLYLQLIEDVISNRAQNEHIAPLINRIKSKQKDIEKLFDFSSKKQFWETNFVVVNLDKVNLEMKKTLPLLLSKHLYAQHKRAGSNKTLNLIIDEAHNILSTTSSREDQSWKDYRLETFEEIIKEGRKFGVFVTIASQRPNDISPTITSQAHNYFIQRLLNQRDLATISSAVSYIDRVTEESIPTLPTGTCVFSGMASQMPLKIDVKALADEKRPVSSTRQFSEVVPVDSHSDVQAGLQ